MLIRSGWVSVVVLYVGYVLLEKNMGFLYFFNPKICSSTSCYSATANAYAIRIHTLPYKYSPLLSPHTNREMFLVICELIHKLSKSLGGDHDGVDSTISDILNKDGCAQ